MILHYATPTSGVYPLAVGDQFAAITIILRCTCTREFYDIQKQFDSNI